LKIERRILTPLKPSSKHGQRRLIQLSNNEKVHLSKDMFNLQISPTQPVTLETPSSPSQPSNSMPHSAQPFPPSQTSKPKSKSYMTVKPNKTSSPSAASSKNTSAQSGRLKLPLQLVKKSGCNGKPPKPISRNDSRIWKK